MTARECLTDARAAGSAYQRYINAFIDEFHQASQDVRATSRFCIRQRVSARGKIFMVHLLAHHEHSRPAHSR